MVLDGSQVTYTIAFIGGLITFFASCLLPLVPTYLAYLSGISLHDRAGMSNKRFRIVGHSLLFVIGFITVFVLLGATASGFGKILVAYKPLIQKIGGLFLTFMGLFMLGAVKPSWLYVERKFSYQNKVSRIPVLNSLIMGFIFGFAWTPCIGPVLAVILFWASQAESVLQGTSLLFVYGIGLGLPFLIIGIFFELLAKRLHKIASIGHRLQLAAGIFILVMGSLLLLGKIEYVSIKLLQFFGLNTLSI